MLITCLVQLEASIILLHPNLSRGFWVYPQGIQDSLSVQSSVMESVHFGLSPSITTLACHPSSLVLPEAIDQSLASVSLGENDTHFINTSRGGSLVCMPTWSAPSSPSSFMHQLSSLIPPLALWSVQRRHRQWRNVVPTLAPRHNYDLEMKL
jgi:hypothetical protein